jgi:hypothetical protein
MVVNLRGRPRNTPVAMPTLGVRQPPPSRGNGARLRASVWRNLSQFELNDVRPGMQDESGDIEQGPRGRGRGRGGVDGTLDTDRVTLNRGGASEEAAQEAHSYYYYCKHGTLDN